MASYEYLPSVSWVLWIREPTPQQLALRLHIFYSDVVAHAATFYSLLLIIPRARVHPLPPTPNPPPKRTVTIHSYKHGKWRSIIPIISNSNSRVMTRWNGRTLVAQRDWHELLFLARGKDWHQLDSRTLPPDKPIVSPFSVDDWPIKLGINQRDGSRERLESRWQGIRIC